MRLKETADGIKDENNTYYRLILNTYLECVFYSLEGTAEIMFCSTQRDAYVALTSAAENETGSHEDSAIVKKPVGK